MKLNGKLLTLYSQKVLSFHQQSNLLKGDRKSPVTTKYRAHLHMSKLFTTQLTEDNAPVFMGHSCLLLTCPSRSAETQHHCSRGRWHCPAGSRTACQEKLPVIEFQHLVCAPPGQTLASLPQAGLGSLRRYFLCPLRFPTPPPSPLPIICCLVW